MARKIPIKKLSLYEHKYGLERLFPKSRIQIINRKTLIWEAEITPSALSKTYTVKLTYTLDSNPKIYVLKPKLTVPEGERLPHTYSGERLCLYYPGEWRKDQALITTIVPWISEWLLHYEIWLATGKWHGGGTHPPIKAE